MTTRFTTDYAPEAGRDHVVVFPFMAKGHTIPLLDFVTALSARHGHLRVTLLTTPANLAFVRRRLPASVELVALPFPSLPPLPAGVESTDALPSPSLYPVFLRATALLRQPFTEFLASLPSLPLAVVSDFFLGFTHGAARDAGVRRVVFHGMSAFSMVISKALIQSPPPQGRSPVRVPGMPESLTLAPEEVPEAVVNITDPNDPVTRFFVDEIADTDMRSWGVLINSFDALDRDYVELFESFYEPGARAWLVGPLLLAAGGSPEAEVEDPEGCLPWLDERTERPGSVVYVSFGTQAYVTDAQLDELAHGLVHSGQDFLFAVRSDTWVPPINDGPSGKIVMGWVPQRRVLAHPAVGGFLSHCGWNSVLESMTAGKPMLTWPVMAEQHVNAKHVVDILGAGIRMAMADAIGRAEVEEKVQKLMDRSCDEGKRARARAEWAQRAAHAAVSDGGTSEVTLQLLIQELQKSYDVDPKTN